MPPKNSAWLHYKVNVVHYRQSFVILRFSCLDIILGCDSKALWRGHYLFHPHPDVLKGRTICDIIDHDDTVGAPVIAAGDRPEAFLASSIPDLVSHLHLKDIDSRHSQQINQHVKRRKTKRKRKHKHEKTTFCF